MYFLMFFSILFIIYWYLYVLFFFKCRKYDFKFVVYCISDFCVNGIEIFNVIDNGKDFL